MILVRVAVVILLAVVVGGVLFNVAAYADARRLRRRLRDDTSPDDEDPRPGLARAVALLRAFLAECGATIALGLSTPLAAHHATVRRAAPGERPVVLLHGYAQHAANFLLFARRLRRDGWRHVHTVGHPPLWGDLERSAERVGRQIERIRARSGSAGVDVVAHSMGGLVARALVRARGPESGIVRLITLGTPHQGTETLRWLTRDPMVAQMRPGSPFLTRLAADDPVPVLVDCIAIYSADDAVVVPPAHGYYPGAFNVEVRDLGHMTLLFSRRVYELVRENLEAPVEPPLLAASHRA